MGNYNPHTPIIMGQEWVPIRDAAYEPDQITESGYTFQLSAATAIVSGAFWVEYLLWGLGVENRLEFECEG